MTTNATTKAMTAREFFTAVLAIENLRPDLANYATAAIQKLDDRNTQKKNTMTKTQAENEDIKDAILAGLSANTTYTAKMIADAFNISTQKVSALCRQLVAAGAMVEIEGYKPQGAKSKVKGYRLADTTDTTDTN